MLSKVLRDQSHICVKCNQQTNQQISSLPANILHTQTNKHTNLTSGSQWTTKHSNCITNKMDLALRATFPLLINCHQIEHLHVRLCNLYTHLFGCTSVCLYMFVCVTAATVATTRILTLLLQPATFHCCLQQCWHLYVCMHIYTYMYVWLHEACARVLYL